MSREDWVRLAYLLVAIVSTVAGIYLWFYLLMEVAKW